MPPKLKRVSLPDGNRKLAGELRRSQISTTYGSGSLIDLPHFSGIVAGIDEWPLGLLDKKAAKIYEPNLQDMLNTEFFYQVSSPETGGDDTPFYAVAHRFPSWYYCPDCHVLEYWNKISLPQGKGDQLNDLYCNQCSTSERKVKLIPSRFVVACLNGHIEEFPYIWWTHRHHTKCQRPELTLTHEGSIGGLERIHIRCKCGAEETMAGCLDASALNGYKCRGFQPWLGMDDEGKTWYRDPKSCDAQPRVLQRNASNIYYPLNISALTIPSWDEDLNDILDENKDKFKMAYGMFTDPTMLRKFLEQEFYNSYPQYGDDLEEYITAADRKFGPNKEEITVQSLRHEEYLAFHGTEREKD